jgi:hypothetical protein
MKKHRSVVSILLAVMMVFTFMPTLTFAQTVESGHNWDDGTVTKKASSCADYTLTEFKCWGENVNDDHLDCGASFTEIEWLGHDFGPYYKPNRKNVSADEFLAQVAKQAPDMYEYYANLIYYGQICYMLVPVCKTCGAYDLNYAVAGIEPFGHQPAKGTKACADTFKCKFCGKEIPNFDAADHTYGDPVYKGTYCSAVDISEDVYAGGYSVWTETCTVCGKVHTYSEINATEEEVEHDGLGAPVTPAAGQEAYYVQYEGKYYAPTEVVEPPTCTAEGTAALYCSKDGQLIGTCAIKAKGHDFVTTQIPATCTFPGGTLVICKDCGYEKEYTVGDAAAGHKYKITELAKPSCFADGITIAECEACGELVEVSGDDFDFVDRDAATGKVYFCGFDDELTGDKRIEIADWLKVDHDYGKYEDMTEATCENGVLQAKKCSVCGLYDVHNTVETGQPLGHKFVTTEQAPTCGNDGFSYDVCSVCGDFANYKRGDKPVVGYGTKCTFDKWIVETAATPFKEGTKKLVCSVCGDDGHLTYEGGEFKESGVTRTSIAKTKIAAPKVKAGKKKATVTVKAVEGAVKYQIKVNGKVKKTVTKAGKVTIKKLAGGKKAKFQIVAFDAEGTKAASKTKSVKIKK